MSWRERAVGDAGPYEYDNTQVYFNIKTAV